MKYHVIVKFLALFLCAASLLGALGGAAGILVVSETGLNSRTPQEAYEEAIHSTAESLANELAVRYAAEHLGNAPEDLIQDYYGYHWMYSTFNWDQVGYTIFDQDGTILEQTQYQDASGTAGTFSFSIDGRYMNIAEVLTEEEYDALYAPETSVPTYPPELTENLWVYNNVPQDGCKIHSVRVVYSDGHTSEYAPEEGYIGQLAYLNPEQLVFRIQSDYPQTTVLMDDLLGSVPTGMTFRDSFGNVICELTSPECLITEFCREPEYFVLLPMETAQPMEPSGITDAIPEGGTAVGECTFLYDGGWEETVAGSDGIGHITHNTGGYVVFTTETQDLIAYRPEQLTYICFRDLYGNILYEARDITGVGSFTLDDNALLGNSTVVFFSRTPSAPTTDIPDPSIPPEPTEPKPEIYVYDDVPPGGYGVYRMEFRLAGSDRSSILELTDIDLGLVEHEEDGSVRFTARDWKQFVFSKPARVVFIRMEDKDGRLLYEAREANVPAGSGCTIGSFAYDGDGNLVFRLMEDAEAAIVRASVLSDSGEAVPTEPLTVSAPTETEPAPTAIADETIPENTEATMAATEPVITAPEAAPAAEGKQYYSYYDHGQGQVMYAEYTFEPMPAYTVEILLGPGALRHGYEWSLLSVLHSIKDYLLNILIVSLLLFAITAVYLCCAAAHRPGSDQVRPGGLNRLPLDLYLAAAAGGILLCAFGIIEGCGYLLQSDIPTGILFAGLLSYLASLLFTAFCFAFAAQVKTPAGYLWHNALVGRCVKLLLWLWKKLLVFCGWLLKILDTRMKPLLVRFLKAMWKLTKFFIFQLKRFVLWLFHTMKKLTAYLMELLGKGVSWMGQKFLRFFSLLPLIWQWLLTGFVLVLLLYIMMRTYKVGYILVGFGAFFGVLLYASSAFGTLLESAKQMRKGDLDQKVDDRLLIGSFRDFADELNGLADVAVVAAQKQLKSERMKTELITNVSHDIKTPLTSIINYVDLMEKPHSPQEQQEYLEVLSRQSQRLKKLVDDLMEMSKASTGNMTVEIARVDAAEAVNQALGEFADKLDKKELIPVFRQPETEIHMMADGRLVWRVLSNLLSNTVKYALPGTRVYIDLMEVDDKVILSLKNISREPLNVSADELLERFVRGDTARNTEGSGLGLNIAKSLMELQKGKLELLVDGDLFKVTLIFPGA